MTDERDRLASALQDRYLLLEEVGSGGMATVYRATEVRHGRTVAVKVLRTEIASTIGRERFLREIRIISQLAHPNILPLYDSGEAGDDLYFVMPFVEGRSLRDEIARKTFLPVEDALRYAAEIGDALDYAHTREILHRDIKPENILLEAGHAIVADFGIAKAIHAAGGTSITDYGLAIGTAAYMSPEQGVGDRKLDERSDLYSLACVVYEMLAGGVPFGGPTPQAIQARKTLEPMPSVRTLRPNLQKNIEDALRRGLAVVPADRYGSAREFLKALHDQAVPRPRWWMPASLGAAAVAAIVVASVLIDRPPVSQVQGARVAVAEFVNRTGDPALDAVGFMAADWITEGLQRVGNVGVVPMPSVMEASRFVRTSRDSAIGALPKALRNETGADLVVSGAFYRTGDTLLVQSRVTDARDGRLLVAIGPITTALGNPSAAITELRTRAMGYFASLVDEGVTSSGAFRDAPPTYEAYQEFSEGMSAYLGSDFRRALGHFVRAHDRDSLLATPLLFASISLSNLGRYAEADSVAAILARQRDRLNSFYQNWLDYRRAFLAGDRPRALASVRRLAQSAPGTKATYNLAVEALENGHVTEAIQALATLSPDRGPTRGWIPYWEIRGALHHLSGDLEKELDDGENARKRFPGRLYALVPSTRALAALGQTRELRDLLSQAERSGVDPAGTSLGSLLTEAAEEAAAHGHAAWADSLWSEAAAWSLTRAGDKTGTRADSLRVSRSMYALARWQTALDWLPRDSSDAEVLALSGLLAVRMGDKDRQEATRRRLENDRRPHLLGAPQLALARIAALQGDTATALASLVNAFRHGREYDLWIHRTTEFASLRNSATYRDIVRIR